MSNSDGWARAGGSDSSYYRRDSYRRRSRSPQDRFNDDQDRFEEDRLDRDRLDRDRFDSDRRRFREDRRRFNSDRRFDSPDRRSDRFDRFEGGSKSSSMRDSQQDRRVYVGNLSYDVKWHHLKDFMRQAGEVLFADVMFTRNRMSKGCGIVEYATRDAALDAIEKLSGQDLMGRTVYVREDREQDPKFSSRGVPATATAGDGLRTRVLAKNLAYSTSWQQLKDFFKMVAPVRRADIFTDADGRSKGSGVIEFENEADAQHVIDSLNRTELDGRVVELREYVETRSRGPPQSRDSFEHRPYSSRSFVPEDVATNAGRSETLYVSNFPRETTTEDLFDLFRTVGPVDHADISPRLKDGNIHFGFVRLGSVEQAERAITKFNGYLYGGLKLGVSFAYTRRPRSEHSHQDNAVRNDFAAVSADQDTAMADAQLDQDKVDVSVEFQAETPTAASAS